MAEPTDTRAAVVEYLTALSADELVALLAEVLSEPDDDQPADADRAAARRIFGGGRA